jgi:hypothetical protein
MLFRKFFSWLVISALLAPVSVPPAAAQTVVRAGTTAVPWASNISCSPGQFVAASPDNLHVFKAVNLTPGTAANTQPTWNIFSGAITVDGSCAWQEQGTLGLPGSGGVQSGPPQTLTNCTAAGTTLNEGVEFSTQLISGVTSLCGTTAAAGSISVVGVCQTGCGNAGAAQIAYSGYQPGIFDNQTTQNHYVVPSASNPGQFTDIGATVPAATTENVGIVASTNTGPGTIATIFLAPLSLFARGSSGGSGVVNPPGCANGIAYYPGLGAVISSDCNFTTNGQGDFTAHSGTFNDASHAGYINIIQGPAPPTAPANGVQVTVPTGVTGYIFSLPGANGTGCIQGNAISGGVQIAFTGVACGTGSGGIEAQVNGIDLSNCIAAVCTLLNIVDGTSSFGFNITCSNPSGGQVKCSVVTPYTQISTPSAPTLTNQNAAGARSITYEIVACENGSTCTQHTPPSSTITIANANASPQVLLKGYGDLLYGPRCFNVIVTADSGARTGVPGVIATCVGKQFIDTGGNGNSTSPANTNTTELHPTSDPGGGGCNRPPDSSRAQDALPCTPNALDDEATQTFGAPADANDPFWTWVNQGVATAAYTGGVLNITSTTAAGVSMHCLVQTAPATPYTVTSLIYWTGTSTSAGTGYQHAWLVFRESGTGKMEAVGLYNQNLNHNTEMMVRKYTSATVASTIAYEGYGANFLSPGNPRIRYDGTNLFFYWSPDGVTFPQAFTEAKNAFFTTAPDQIGICLDPEQGASMLDMDYFRVLPQ